MSRAATELDAAGAGAGGIAGGAEAPHAERRGHCCRSMSMSTSVTCTHRQWSGTTIVPVAVGVPATQSALDGLTAFVADEGHDGPTSRTSRAGWISKSGRTLLSLVSDIAVGAAWAGPRTGRRPDRGRPRQWSARRSCRWCSREFLSAERVSPDPPFPPRTPQNRAPLDGDPKNGSITKARRVEHPP